MAIDRFSSAYAKARRTVNNYEWPGSWETLLKQTWRVPSLMSKDGLEYAHASGLDKLRETITTNSKYSAAEVIAGAASGERKGILGALGIGKGSDCAATLKMLKHLYFERKRGGQDVWVYSPPKHYKKWIFDEIKGSPESMKAKLAHEDEVYSEAQKKAMADALQMALRWSKMAMMLTSMPFALGPWDSRPYIKRWFAVPGSTEAQIEQVRKKLAAGYKKIAAVCNSHRLIFSDEPLDRAGGGWPDWAFVYSSEKIDVVYLQNEFLEASRDGRLWECALTIIHEISHRELKTDDHAYADQKCIRPDKKHFSTKTALDNADNWGFFATDVAGQLPKNKLIEALTGTYG